MKSILSIFAMTMAFASISAQALAGKCTYTGHNFYFSISVNYEGPGGGRYTVCNYVKKDSQANWYYSCQDGSTGYMDRNRDDVPLVHNRAGKCTHMGLF